MFRVDLRREEQKQKERELLSQIQRGEKPKFKDLVSIMIAQYLIVLPVAFLGMIAFALILRGLLLFWS